MRAVALGFGLVLVGCGEPPAPAPTAAVAASPTPAAEPDVIVLPPYVVPSQHGEVVGHVRLADSAALLATLQAMLPESWAEPLSLAAVRKRLAQGASPARAAMIEHVDAGQPAACVLLDPVQRSNPVACVFGYAGGLPQLRTDLGAQGVVDDGEAALHIERDGVAWFFDVLGDRIVFAMHGDAFEASRDYLDALKNPGGARDVELVLHTAHAARAYRAQITALIIAASGAAQRQAPATFPALDAARDELSGLGPEVTEHALDALDEFVGLGAQAERVELYATVTPSRIVSGMRIVPTPDTALRQWATQARPLPSALWQWLPQGTWLVWASQRNSAGDLRPQWRALQWQVFAHYLARFVERSSEDLTAAADNLAVAQREAYGDWSLLAAYNSPATRGGAVLVRPKNPTVDARAAWLALAQAATPQALFGDTLGRTVANTIEWNVVPNAATIEGLTVDEWRMHAAPGLLDRLDASLDEGGVGKQVVAAMRGRDALLAIQRFELDDAVVFTVAPGGGASYASTIIRAKKGEGRLATTGLDAIVGSGPSVPALAALSVFDLLQAIRETLPPELRGEVPAAVGQDLSDAHYRLAVDDAGVMTHEIAISTSVFQVLRQAMPVERRPVEPDQGAP